MESRGKPIVYEGQPLIMMASLAVSNGFRASLTREATSGEMRQGISIRPENCAIGFDSELYKDQPLVFWEDTAPKAFEFSVESCDPNSEPMLYIKNIWDMGNGVIESWHNGSAMRPENIENGVRFYCNDGVPDGKFDDIVFTLTSDDYPINIREVSKASLEICE